MRGKELPEVRRVQAPGITPAYAGKSAARHRPCAESKDHPRVCGEKSDVLQLLLLYAGSPPRMRGKGADLASVTAATRITPAYAGKSRRFSTLLRCPRDHPRVCGEKSGTHYHYDIDLGSPPRMRGKAEWEQAVVCNCGITPAYAGKRAEDWFNHRLQGDHPRVCGEKPNRSCTSQHQPGSPPRMRGKDAS